MTLSATPSACALGGGASAKASGGRARHTHPSQPQNPFSLLLSMMTSTFFRLRPVRVLLAPLSPLVRRRAGQRRTRGERRRLRDLGEGVAHQVVSLLVLGGTPCSRGSLAGQRRQLLLGVGREPRI